MGMSVHNDVLDGALAVISANADRESACEGEPTTYEHATSLKGVATGKAGSIKSDPGFTGPAEGDVSGRKLTVDQNAGVAVGATVTADHVALADSVNSKLLFVTTCTEQVLTSGNTCTFPAWDIEIADPEAPA